jgi:hypothetical protein
VSRDKIQFWNTMPYSQFTTLHNVRQHLGVQTTFKKLFPDVAQMTPGSWLEETIAKVTAQRTAFFSEKSRSEAIVFPILMTLQERFEYRFSLYSGATIEGDKSLGLNGECDFVLSKGHQSIELERPVFCVVEAKDNDIDLGIPQCIAQLVGTRMFNEREGLDMPVLYGCITTGTEWIFLKFENSLVTIDTQNYYLNDLPTLLGVMKKIVEELM